MRARNIPAALTLCYEASKTIELRSTPGAGKSSIVEQWAAHRSKTTGRPFGLFVFMLATISPYDFGGFMYPAADPDDPSGQRVSAFSRPPVIPHPSHFRSMRGSSFMVFVDGEKVDTFDGVPDQGAIFLDEYGQADVDMKKMSADLMLNRRVRGAALPQGWSVIAASNRQEDRSGVTKDLSFVLNRVVRVDLTNSIDDFKAFAMKTGAHYLVTAWASFAPEKVFSQMAPEAGQQFCTPRSLMAVSDLIHTMERTAPIVWRGEGDDEKRADFIREMVHGTIGTHAGTEFVAFAAMASQLATFEQIVKDPQGAPMPEASQADALHAVCDMVATRVDAKTAVPAFDYILRAPREFQVATLINAVQKAPKITLAPKFQSWLSKNNALVVSANITS